MKQVDVMKRDNILVAFLAQHRGMAHCVSSSEICEHLNECGYKTQKDCVHGMIRKVMFERTIPICSITAKVIFGQRLKTKSNRLYTNFKVAFMRCKTESNF